MEILYFSLYGIFAGLAFLICLFFRRLTNYNIVTTVILDILWGASCSLLFGMALLLYANGIFKVIQICAFVLGIVVCIISLEKLVASVANFVYNKIVLKLFYAFKSLLTKRKSLWKQKNLQK